MAGDAATLALGIDASGASRGAGEFVDALKHIEAAGRHAEAALKEIGVASDKAATGTDKLSKSTQDLDRSLTSTKSGLLGFVAGLGTAVGAMAAMQLREFVTDLFTVADAYQRLDARIAMYVGGTENAAKAHQLLLAAAQATGVSFESTGGFFAKLASQADTLGLSYEELVGVTQTVQQALILSGASASETASGMQQLGQAFTRGKLGGDEFITMGESAAKVLDILQEALGVSRGELAEMSKDGQLTSQVMSAAFQNMESQTTASFESLGNTVSQESTRMQNAWNELLVELNKTGGASELAISGISTITEFLSSPATHASINDLAKDIRSLIEDMKALGGMGAVVAQHLNAINQMVQDAGKAVNRALGIGRAPFGETALFKGAQGGATGSWTSDFKSSGDLPQVEAKFPQLGVRKEIVVPPKQAGGGGKSAATLAKEAESFTNKTLQDNLRAHDKQVELINMRRDLELKALQSISKSESEKAALAVKINDTAAAEIANIKNKGASKASKDAESEAKKAESVRDRILQTNLKATDQEIALVERKRDEELQALAAVKMSAEEKASLTVKVQETAAAQIAEIRKKDAEEEQKKQDAALKSLGRYEEANLQVHGRMTELIIRQRDEEFRAINADKGMSDEQKAQARVLAEDTASQQIIEIRRREADEIASLQEENLQTKAGNAFGSERKQLQKQLLEMKRDSALADIQASQMSDEMKAQATSIKSDTFAQQIAVIDPTPWEAASRNLQEFGENLTSVDGISQGVIQGIANIGNTAASAFADAIVSGESFADTLETLGKTLEKMLIQMTLQMAMQAALGAGASYLGAAMGPSAGTPYSPAEGAGVFGGTAATMAKGGIVRESAGLASGVYSQPTYFRTADAAPRATGALAGPGGYDTAFAKGGVIADNSNNANSIITRPTYFMVHEPRTYTISAENPTVNFSSPPTSGRSFAKGGAIGGVLEPGIYTQPTRFPMQGQQPQAMAKGGVIEHQQSYDTAFAKGGVFEKALADRISSMTAGAQPSHSKAFAKGGVVESETANKVYTRPTYMAMKEPGVTPMARGRGLMGEAGPEAVLPLTRTPTGQLGVSTSGDGGGGGAVNITVNNNSKANVSTESSDDGKGNKDIIMTIADQVEGVVASRMSRSGTRVNRAVSSVGGVVAR